jgi:hypothetical protein
MTLIQKLRTVVVMQLRSGRDESRDLEKIADDYAIEFAEWIEEYQGGTPNSKILKELLEIFKKEKGL